MPADAVFTGFRCFCPQCMEPAGNDPGFEARYYIPDPPKIPEAPRIPDPPTFPNGTQIPDPPVIPDPPTIPDAPTIPNPPGSDTPSGTSGSAGSTGGATGSPSGAATDFTPLLKPAGIAWNGANLGAPALVPYSFATRASGHYAQDGSPAQAGFDPQYSEPLDAAQRASIVQALAAWESVSGLVFIEIPDPAEFHYAGIRFLLEDLDDPNKAGLTYSYLPEFADVVFAREHYADDALGRGTYGFLTALHEIGHAIGLKHPFESGTTLAQDLDNNRNTVMSYTDAGNYGGLGPLDVAAVQHLYGTQEAEQAAPVRWARGPNGSLVTTGDDAPNFITGLAIRDVVQSNGGNDHIELGAGDDEAAPGAGDDAVFGGAGADTLVAGALRRQATVALGPGQGTVALPDGFDSFYGVETLRFLDGDLALSGGGAAGQAYRLYDAVLGRAPDAVGLSHWAAALQSGALTFSDAAGGFAASAEFAARYGAPGDAGFVSLLYANVLGRAPDAAGMRFWTEAMQGGGGRAGALAGFAESAEFRQKTAAAFAGGVWVADPEAVDVMRAYLAVLDRLPDGGGLAAWTAARNAGLAQSGLVERFVSSAEFQDRFGGLSNRDFVQQLYRTALDREADAEGLAGWTRILDSGEASRAGVASGFAGSAEMAAKVAPWVADGLHFV